MKTAALLIAHRANPWRKGKCVLNGFLNQFPLERQLFLSAKKVNNVQKARHLRKNYYYYLGSFYENFGTSIIKAKSLARICLHDI